MANNSNELEYTRRLYDNVLDWYKNADTKAQVVLAINGGFITFVGSSVFKRAEEVKPVLLSFDNLTWIISAFMISSLIGSIGAAIYCLWSRIYSEKTFRCKYWFSACRYHFDSVFCAVCKLPVKGYDLERYRNHAATLQFLMEPISVRFSTLQI